MRKYVLSIAVAALALASACTTVPQDDSYLIKSLDDSSKAAALANQGVAAYNAYLVHDANFSKAGEVREYFIVALRYDPDNLKAKQYLEKVDDFKNSLVSEKLKAADRLLAKPKRKEDEDYALIVALQTASSLDPSNAQAVKLLKDNSSVQISLSDSFLQRSKDIQAKAAAASTDSAREALFVEAYDNAAKASAVAPTNVPAQKQKSTLRLELDKSFDKHKAQATTLIEQGKYEDAKAELGRMGSLDSKTGRAHGPELSAVTYLLYYQWAKVFMAKGSYPEAGDRIDLALSAKRSDEALALKKKISAQTASISQKAAAQAASANQDASFDAALPEIDKLIAKGDLLGANKRIAAASKMVKDQARLDQLDPRRAKITASLDDFYQKGVASYRAEDFKAAIAQLKVVVGINADYEQASDYLDKAQEKQKLLDQYTN
jgi:hypothetical protein